MIKLEEIKVVNITVESETGYVQSHEKQILWIYSYGGSRNIGLEKVIGQEQEVYK